MKYHVNWNMVFVGVLVVIIATIGMLSPVSAFGFQSSTQTTIVWNLTNATNGGEASTLAIDGVPIVDFAGNYYVQGDLQPGTTHFAYIDAHIYQGTTNSSTGTDDTDTATLWLFAIVITAYVLAILVYEIPLAIIPTLAYDLWVAGIYLPAHISIIPTESGVFFLLHVAAWISIAASCLACKLGYG